MSDPNENISLQHLQWVELFGYIFRLLESGPDCQGKLKRKITNDVDLKTIFKFKKNDFQNVTFLIAKMCMFNFVVFMQ